MKIVDDKLIDKRIAGFDCAIMSEGKIVKKVKVYKPYRLGKKESRQILIEEGFDPDCHRLMILGVIKRVMIWNIEDIIQYADVSDIIEY